MKNFNYYSQREKKLSAPSKNAFLSVIAVLLLLVSTGFVLVNDKASNDPFSPGVVFEIEVKDHSQSPPKTSEMEVKAEGKNLSMDVLPGDRGNGKGKMIYRADKGDKGEVIIVDHDTKSYSVIDDSFAKQVTGKMDESKKMMEEMMKSLTKEQRDAIEKAQKQSGGKMPGMMPGMAEQEKPEIRKTGERGTKAGYPCVKYEVLLNGVKTRELWITDWGNITGGDEARKAFLAMSEFFEDMLKDVPGMPGGQNPYEAMNFENGFPVVTREFNDDGELDEESTLRSAKRRTIDPDEFEPPAGYKRRSMLGGN